MTEIPPPPPLTKEEVEARQAEDEERLRQEEETRAANIAASEKAIADHNAALEEQAQRVAEEIQPSIDASRQAIEAARAGRPMTDGELPEPPEAV